MIFFILPFLDREHIFPQKDDENRLNFKQSSVTKKKKRKFSALECDTPKSPCLIKKSLRKESFDNFSLYHSKDLLSTAIKNVSSEDVSPLKKMSLPISSLEIEENVIETEVQNQEDSLQALEEFTDVVMETPLDIKFLSVSKQFEDAPDCSYLGTKQKEMTWNMRVILLDWMMEVCNDYMLKRQTFYMAVNYVDRFCSLYSNLPKSKLQLLGAVSLYVASKLEEIYPPKLQDFALVGHDYGENEIKEFEELLLRTLKFKLNPCTVTFWADWLMLQWDMLMEEKEKCPNALSFLTDSHNFQFKQPNEISYKLYREFYQILDCVMLDCWSLKFNLISIVLSVMCLLLWGYLNKLEMKQVRSRYMDFLVEDKNGVYRFFEAFLQRTFNLDMQFIKNEIEFCSLFFGLDLEYDYPRATNIDRENVLEVFFLLLDFK